MTSPSERIRTKITISISLTIKLNVDAHTLRTFAKQILVQTLTKEAFPRRKASILAALFVLVFHLGRRGARPSNQQTPHPKNGD